MKRTPASTRHPGDNQSQELTRRVFVKRAVLAACAASASCVGSAKAAAPAQPSKANPLKVAVITGGHLFDVPNFHRLFRSWPEIDAYIQHIVDFAGSPPEVRDSYDVVLFYIMQMDPLQNEKLGPQLARAKEAIERLRNTSQGIVVMHHALLAYPDWPVWSELVGIPDRRFGFHHDEKVKVNVADSSHPITRGLKAWEMIDETYTMKDAGEGSQILLTTDHPKSMKTIAWAREFGKSRVFCTESGHDNQTWVDPNFKEVLRRGMIWSARKLE